MERVGLWLHCLFADDNVLVGESEGELQRVVDELNNVSGRRKPNVNVGKKCFLRGRKYRCASLGHIIE